MLTLIFISPFALRLARNRQSFSRLTPTEKRQTSSEKPYHILGGLARKGRFSSDRLKRAVIRRSLLLRRDFRVQAAQAALHLEESVCLLLGPADPFGFGRFRRAFPIYRHDSVNTM